jgi:hypothetical protein
LARTVYLDTFDYFELGFGACGDALKRATRPIRAPNLTFLPTVPQAAQRLRGGFGRNEQTKMSRARPAVSTGVDAQKPLSRRSISL